MEINNITDIHSHVLPGIDDGAQNLPASLILLHMLAEQGVGRLVLTPHFYSYRESLEDFLARRTASMRQLLSTDYIREADPALHAAGGPYAIYSEAQIFDGTDPRAISLYLAAEVYLTEMVQSLEDVQPLLFGRERYLLLEMPFDQTWQTRTYQQIDALVAKFGITPVIAHVEHYPAGSKGRNTDVLNELTKRGCLLQINVDSFGDRKTRKAIHNLLKDGWVDAIGSDAHDPVNRPPRFKEFEAIVAKKIRHFQYEDVNLPL